MAKTTTTFSGGAGTIYVKYYADGLDAGIHPVSEWYIGALGEQIKQGERYKIIVNRPRVIYLLKTDFGIFKGIALCQPEDNFDLQTGIDIAYRKAKTKEIDKRMRQCNRELLEIEQEYSEKKLKNDKIWAKLIKELIRINEKRFD